MSRADGLSADARDQISRLRDQVDALMRDRVNPALSEASDRAQSYYGQAQQAYGQASDVARDQADALGERVKEQPLIAILVAAGVGYLVGRIVR